MSTSYINDTFGEKIGGSKRDIRRAFNDGDFSLDGMDEQDLFEVRKMATKEKIWPEPDWQSLEVSPEISIRVKMLRNALPLKCPTKMDTKTYVDSMVHIKNLAEESLATNIQIESNEVILPAFENGLMPVSRRAINKVLNRSEDQCAFLAEIAEWPKKTDSLIFDGYMPHKFGGYSRGEKVENIFVVRKGKSLVNNEKFPSLEKCIDYINNELPDFLKNKKKKAKNISPVRPMLKNIVRTGPEYEEDITPELFQETFQFRGGEFGVWLTQEDRKQSLKYAYDAFMDLATVLKISPGEIGNNTLGFAFGARGAGKASAHYEPGLKVINLTKMNGAGATAHEWGHYIDFMAGSQLKGKNKAFSEYNMNWLSYLPSTPEQQEKNREKRIHEIIDTLSTWNAESKKLLDMDIKSEEFTNAYTTIVSECHRMGKKNRESFKTALHYALSDGYGKNTKTSIARGGESLDAKRSKKYWGTQEELFARAFEKYVGTRMVEEGISNNYLVSLYEYPSTDENIVHVYPTDEEMELMRPHIEKFLDTIFPSRLEEKESEQQPLRM